MYSARIDRYSLLPRSCHIRPVYEHPAGRRTGLLREQHARRLQSRNERTVREAVARRVSSAASEAQMVVEEQLHVFVVVIAADSAEEDDQAVEAVGASERLPFSDITYMADTLLAVVVDDAVNSPVIYYNSSCVTDSG